MYKPISPQRQEIIREILLKYSGSVPGYEALQRELWSSSDEQLERILRAHQVAASEAAQSPAVEAQRRLAEIQADRKRQFEEHQLTVIFRTPVNGRVAIDNIANRQVISSWIHEDQGESINVTWFQKVLKESPTLAKSLTWQSADILDPAKRRQAEAAQDAEERRVFHDFCRDNSFSEVQANLSLVKSVLGSFDQHSLAQAVQSNALQLAQASPEELEKFRQEQIANHNRYLRSLDITSLRKLAREAGARGPVAQPLDETQRIRQEERNAGTVYEKLPPDISAEDILTASVSKLKFLKQKYGNAQLDTVLADYRQANAVINRF